MALVDDEIRSELPGLRRFALSLTRNASAADDLVQASLERAFVREATRNEGGNLRAWLFSILYRQFLDGQRGRRRFGRLLSALRAQAADRAAGTPEDVFFASTELRAFARLPQEQRAVLMLVAVEGLGYREAAEVLDVPIGTVMSRLSRARAALSKLNETAAVRPLRLVRRG
jgi:RNA polymerase sigma-70 factor, ECF subfamily